MTTPNPTSGMLCKCRGFAMIAASVLVLVTQKPAQFVVVLFMSAVREAQEGFIDPLYPMADAPMSPIVDFRVYVVIVAAEVTALIVVYRLSKRDDAVPEVPAVEAVEA